MKLNCFLCHKPVNGIVNNLRRHFIEIHRMKFKRGNSFANFECAQPKCLSKFNSFHAFTNHIKIFHSAVDIQQQNESNINTEFEQPLESDGVCFNYNENLGDITVNSSEPCKDLPKLKKKIEKKH